MTLPSDSDAVLRALRLGWYVAEVRGRNRLDAPTGAVPTLPERLDHALPLRNERDAEELRIEAQKVLARLSTDCGVNADAIHANYALEIEQKAHALDDARNDAQANPSAEDIWGTFADLIFYYDAQIQDKLSAISDRQATAYLLGRGLSEAYWALDPKAEAGAITSWTFLLGDARCTELSRNVGRLSAYFSAYTAAAVSGSIAGWRKVVDDKTWREREGAVLALYLQIRSWYELLVLGQDPSTLIKPYAILKSWRGATQALRTFAVQIITLGLSLVLLVGLTFLASYGKTSATANTILGILTALGVTTAALQSRVKNSAQAVSTRLRQDSYTDLVAADITILPKIPGRSVDQMRKLTIEACQERTLTTNASA